ncbi:MAG: triose-phosphate isomerase [Candidatus Alcyoniella australis]|nr:triose-phosphate isomerase [Candidatus Alcyoniella australis]
MRQPLLAGNWKMNKTIGQTREFIERFVPLIRDVSERQVAIMPPFTALPAVAQLLSGGPVAYGAQNCAGEAEGAYTGEVSPLMLGDLGCRFVIIGHSERRRYFGESNGSCNKKIRLTLQHDLTPIYCIGETLDQREADETLKTIENQVKTGLAGIGERVSEIVIAYEPIWAIGTGVTATPEQVQQVHGHIRNMVAETYGYSGAEDLRIIYGGSVKPDNVDELMARPDVDGALVGGASLDPDDFARIVKFSDK